MNIREKFRFLWQNMVIYMVGLFLLLGMKYLYSKADCESLLWILGPTARWVEVLSGIPFVYEPGMGYANHGLRFLIAPSCSGVQFMIITAAMLIFSFSHRVMDCRNAKFPDESAGAGPFGHGASTGSGRQNAIKRAPGTGRRYPQAIRRIWPGLGWIVLSLLLSYLITIFVNGLRIVAAIYLPYFFRRIDVFDGPLTPDMLHTMIGVVVYFAALLTIYRLAGFLFDRFRSTDEARPSSPILGKCLAPLFWYFFIVLGIPFLNRAYRRSNGQFAEFALLVTLCCGAVLLFYGLALLIRRKLRGRG
ncbi:MAG: exosortase K [Lachnospiraceae bacterium]|nr:exosortase K [Lachnospiraceae bacterium]